MTWNCAASRSSPGVESPLERWPQLGQRLGVDLLIKRDDLLPFPLAGNKFRKLLAEKTSSDWRAGDVLLTNGAVASNHARTLAFMGASLGCDVDLVLHGGSDPASRTVSMRMLNQLGARTHLVDSSEIGPCLDDLQTSALRQGRRVHRVPGGAHTPAAVDAYRQACAAVLEKALVDVVVVASGTGATQAGLILGAEPFGSRVVGVSVARDEVRGSDAVRECLGWFGKDDLQIEFQDRFLDGGYGVYSSATEELLSIGWRHGLPLDGTYTAKAFRGLAENIGTLIAPGSVVLFWHTGGLTNFIDG